MYQVRWFSKKKGYGFVLDESGVEYFVHHSDIESEGYAYLMMGECVLGELSEVSGRGEKLTKVRSAMRGGKLVCDMMREEKQ